MITSGGVTCGRDTTRHLQCVLVVIVLHDTWKAMVGGRNVQGRGSGRARHCAWPRKSPANEQPLAQPHPCEIPITYGGPYKTRPTRNHITHRPIHPLATPPTHNRTKPTHAETQLMSTTLQLSPASQQTRLQPPASNPATTAPTPNPTHPQPYAGADGRATETGPWPDVTVLEGAN